MQTVVWTAAGIAQRGRKIHRQDMFFIIGIVIVFGSVAGGYAPHGDLRVLW